MTLVLDINNASCGKKLLQISEHFIESVIKKFEESELAIVQLTLRDMVWVVMLCFLLHLFIVRLPFLSI